MFIKEKAGEWYQLDEKKKVFVWRHTGSNGFTKNFSHFIFLLPDKRTVYVYGSGI